MQQLGWCKNLGVGGSPQRNTLKDPGKTTCVFHTKVDNVCSVSVNSLDTTHVCNNMSSLGLLKTPLFMPFKANDGNCSVLTLFTLLGTPPRVKLSRCCYLAFSLLQALSDSNLAQPCLYCWCQPSTTCRALLPGVIVNLFHSEFRT